MCREYAHEQGWQIVAELAEDDRRTTSGASWDLPEMKRALDLAQAGKADVMVLRDMDRFARKLAKQLVIEEQFRRAGVDVVYALEEYADTPEGRLNKHIRATIAEYEREKTRERMVRGRRLKARAGNVIPHGNILYGYKRVEEGGPSR
jgi:site-specific DNA recombinase